MELDARGDHPTHLFENGDRRQLTGDDWREFLFPSARCFEFRQLPFKKLLLIGLVDSDLEGDASRSGEISKSLSILHHDTREVLRRTALLYQTARLEYTLFGWAAKWRS
mgnify:CR=1 FL=1